MEAKNGKKVSSQRRNGTESYSYRRGWDYLMTGRIEELAGRINLIS